MYNHIVARRLYERCNAHELSRRQRIPPNLFICCSESSNCTYSSSVDCYQFYGSSNIMLSSSWGQTHGAVCDNRDNRVLFLLVANPPNSYNNSSIFVSRVLCIFRNEISTTVILLCRTLACFAWRKSC